MTTVRTRVLHNLQISAEVEGHRFLSDEAVDKGGHDAGPAPLRYFLAGIAMCHEVWLVKGAVLRDLELEVVAGEITGYLDPNMPSSGGRPFSRIAYRVEIVGDLDTTTLGELMADARRNCPAVATVESGTRLEITAVLNGVES